MGLGLKGYVSWCLRTKAILTDDINIGDNNES